MSAPAVGSLVGYFEDCGKRRARLTGEGSFGASEDDCANFFIRVKFLEGIVEFEDEGCA
jgi:hypothetical protein